MCASSEAIDPCNEWLSTTSAVPHLFLIRQISAVLVISITP